MNQLPKNSLRASSYLIGLGQTCKRQFPRSNVHVRSNVNIALHVTLTLFQWVSGEMAALHNAASGFFPTTVTINQQKIIIFI